MHRSLFVRQRLVGEPAYSHPCDEFLEIQVDDNQIEHEYGHFDIERYNSDFAKGKPDLVNMVIFLAGTAVKVGQHNFTSNDSQSCGGVLRPAI